MRKQEHIRCGCSQCKRGAGTPYGQFTHRQINRKIRHATKQGLKAKGEDFIPLILSTPYTD